MSNKGYSVIESSFISPENKGLLSSKDEINKEQKIVNDNNEINGNLNEPLVIPSSFISSSKTNVDVKQSVVPNSKLNTDNKVDILKKSNKDIKVKKNVKKVKPKIYKGNKLTRILKKELIESPNEDCWVILQSIHPEFDSVKISKKHFKSCCFGRQERNDIKINSELISAIHCCIYYKHKEEDNPDSPLEVHIADLSTNGTYINGRLIGKNKSVKVFHGQEIGFILNPKKGVSGVIPEPNEIQECERAIEEDYQIGELLGS
ncbi:hypothetical protein PIROE2DRAFT_4997 [Piromyces sp. E2]|nr:hypothetical protein PIROE2DRAFT_4997 [Piromyces sp. E2]|eukprot:OUM67582.1 hypothetical protein PIROE2DRAFT_4997 [Piromyces sp. E2]